MGVFLHIKQDDFSGGTVLAWDSPENAASLASLPTKCQSYSQPLGNPGTSPPRPPALSATFRGGAAPSWELPMSVSVASLGSVMETEYCCPVLLWPKPQGAEEGAGAEVSLIKEAAGVSVLRNGAHEYL